MKLETETVGPNDRSQREATDQRPMTGAFTTVDNGWPDQVEAPAALVGKSSHVYRLRRMVAHLARLDSHVLILGETGTQPEEMARYIHQQSRRCLEPLVSVDCGATPSEVLDRWLFGERRLVFNDAFWDRPGQIEEAGEGAVILVGIDELSAELQTKLLHFCKTGEFVRVDGEEIRKSPARLFCIAREELRNRVTEGSFRDDLYYLLHQHHVRLVPLRERPEDLPFLVRHMVHLCNDGQENSAPTIDRAVIDVLRLHTWPGNQQELQSVIREALVVSDDGVLRLEHLPEPYSSVPNGNLMSLEENERLHIERILRHTGFNKSRAAKILRISRPTLNNKIYRYGLKLKFSSKDLKLWG
jgi:DNA-binding NtrC family response regulator